MADKGKRKRIRVDLTLNPVITALAEDFFGKRDKTLSGEVDRLLEEFLLSKGIDLNDERTLAKAKKLLSARKSGRKEGLPVTASILKQGVGHRLS